MCFQESSRDTRESHFDRQSNDGEELAGMAGATAFQLRVDEYLVFDVLGVSEP